MPNPVGQSCSNCQNWGNNTETGDERSCLWRPPGWCGVSKRDRWRRTSANKWCAQWAGSSGTGGLLNSDVGVGYRGQSTTGDPYSLTPTYQLLTPTFAAVTNTLNFELTSPGVLTLNYTTYTPSPTFEIYVTVMGVVVLRSNTNNQAVGVTIGQNGTPEDVYGVLNDVKTTGQAVPIPVAAGLTMKNGDTVSLWAKDTASGPAELIAFHMLLEGFRVVTF